MSKKNRFLQFRIPRADKHGAELIAKLEKIAEANGLSVNDACNLAVAAGLSMVEKKLSEIKNPLPEAA